MSKIVDCDTCINLRPGVCVRDSTCGSWADPGHFWISRRVSLDVSSSDRRRHSTVVCLIEKSSPAAPARPGSRDHDGRSNRPTSWSPGR